MVEEEHIKRYRSCIRMYGNLFVNLLESNLLMTGEDMFDLIQERFPDIKISKSAIRRSQKTVMVYMLEEYINGTPSLITLGEVNYREELINQLINRLHKIDMPRLRLDKSYYIRRLEEELEICQIEKKAKKLSDLRRYSDTM